MENNSQNPVNFTILDSNEQNITNENKVAKIHKFSNVDFNSKDTNLDIKIIGVGGAGCNIINHLNLTINEINSFANLYAFNTDAWSLKSLNGINNLFIIDKPHLKGYGSAGNPLNAKEGIIHDSEAIKEELKGTDALFLVTGFGKGTGSGATPEIAKIATEMGILTIAIVGIPSITCEGKETYTNALNSLEELKKYATSITTICNERIAYNNPGINFFDLYNKANDNFATIVNYIVSMVMKPSQMNIDFSDIKSFFDANRFFMLNHLVLENSDIDQENFNLAIAKQINWNISDVNVKNSKDIIAKLILSKTTSNDFLLSFKKACASAIENEKVNVVSGVDYSNDEKIKITYVIAATDQLENLTNLEYQDSKKLQNEDKEVKENTSSSEFGGLVDEINSVLSPTKDLDNGLEDQPQEEDDSNQNQEQQPISSDESQNDIG